jgi:hypothetical protein
VWLLDRFLYVATICLWFVNPEKCSSYVSSTACFQLYIGILACCDMARLLSSSIYTQVRLASVTLQLQTWLGLAPHQVVTAVLVIVMVSRLQRNLL